MLKMQNYKFNPNKLSGNYLHIGGFVDDNGNIFREKDVLEEDYSNPILLGGKKYDVKDVKEISQNTIGIFLNDGQGLILSKAEFEQSVCNIKKSQKTPTEDLVDLIDYDSDGDLIDDTDEYESVEK